MNATSAVPKPLWVMDIPVTPFESSNQVIECVASAITARRKVLCVAVNPEKVYRAQRDPALRSLLQNAEITICDGVGAALAARVLHGRRIARCTGVDTFMNLIAAAPQRNWRIFLLGASPETNAKAAERLVEQHPDLQIVGRRDGYFREAGPVIDEINASRPDLLFVAMGSPRQEFWITEHRAELDVPFCMGVGGTLDVAAGTVKRAPALFRKTGTEFFYRLLAQPQRIRRQIVLPLFAAGVLKQALWRRPNTVATDSARGS